MPTTSFSDLGLSDAVLEAVADLGYEAPTPVQAQAIPYVLEGRDLLAAAQTGTGKTAAFVLPALSTLPRAARHEGPSMLVVTPTRELAQQIADVCSAVERRTRHRSATVVGGVGYEPQKAALKRGCDVLVATPGRLVDLIQQGCCDLSGVRVLVLDEADRMLDMGFLPAMRTIVAATPDDRQTLLFSATLDEKAIGGIRDLVHDPATVEIARLGSVADTIDQYVLPVSPEAKNGLLAQVVCAEGSQRVIVFCRTKHRADACCRRLRRTGVSCAPIHGNRSQNQRERALAGFRSGEVDVLVATDVLARGIDVTDVRYVVNFDVPADPEDYIHRIGRTGRAGETGWALTFVTADDAEDLFAIESLMGQVVPTWARAGEFELGEQPVELDPQREAGRRRTKRSRSGSRRGSGSGRRGGSGKSAAARGAEKGKASGSGSGRAAAGERPARPRAERGVGDGSGKAAQPRTAKADKPAAPADGPADNGSGRPSQPKVAKGRDGSGDGRRRNGSRRGVGRNGGSGRNGSSASRGPASGRGGSKGRRRPGDQAGRRRGIV